MRTREKRYADYGLTDSKAKELMAFCRNPDNAEIVRRAVVAANPLLSDNLFVSLTEGKGNDRQYRYIYRPPATKADFYAYRRLTLAVLDILLREGDSEWEDGGAAARIRHITR